MPFTASHAAAVLPLTRWGLPPSALVVGSMSPDLPYYLPTPMDGAATHSLAGIVGADLVAGLVVLGLWHALLARFAIAVAPAPLRDRLRQPGPGRARPAVRAVLVVVALVLGAATHVLWDSFTHIGRWGPAHIDWLAQTHAGLPGYRWAQYASGLAGAVAIAFWLVRWWRATPPAPPARRHRPAPPLFAAASWTVIALTTATGALVAALPALRDADPRGAVFLAVTRGGGAGLMAALVCAVLLIPAAIRAAKAT